MSDTHSQFEKYRISKYGDPYLYSVNRSVFEKNPCKITFDSFFQEKLDEEDYFYIILGCDSGLLTDYVIQRGLAKGSKYLFIDSSHVIDNLNEQLSFSEWDEKVALATLSNWEQIAEKLDLQAYMYTDKVRYIQSIAATDGYDEFYYQANSEVSLKLERQQNYTMISLYRAPFIVKQIINLPDNLNPMIALKDKFKGMDCIILGGGPSLDEVIEDLKSIDEDVVLIAASRIASRLIDEGITPHFIISVDPHEVSFDVSKEMLEMADNSIFLHSTYVVPVLVGQWRGIAFHDGLRVPWPSELSNKNVYMEGPTVTNSAISAAVEFGFDRIFLTGVDLCYSSEGFTHAKGSNEAKVGPMLGKRENWVKTYSGKLAETAMTFIHASHTIKTQADQAINAGSQLINLSPNAAKIENIPQQDLESIKFSKDKSLPELIKEIRTDYGTVDTNQFNLVSDDIDRLNKELDEIKDIVEQALKDNTALYKTYEDPEENAKLKDKLDAAEDSLNNEYEKTATFLKKYGIHRFIQIARTDADEEWSDEEMEEIGRKYYQCFIDNINELTPLLEAAKEKINLRKQEFEPNPDFEAILDQWQSEAHYGRAYNWKLKNPEQYEVLPNNIKERFEVQIALYFRILENTDTAHLKRTQSQSNLDGVNRKAVYMFNAKNASGLESLINNLKKMESKHDECNQLIILCSAYFAMLSNKNRDALKLFHSLESEYLSEDELIQISVLEIEAEDYIKAEVSLGKLAELNPNYAPKYATILKLNGKGVEAERVYTEYLQNTPLDLKVWLELANLYVEAKALEHAVDTFKHILTLDSENIEAKRFLEYIENKS